MAPWEGFEPPSSSFVAKHSSTELPRHLAKGERFELPSQGFGDLHLTVRLTRQNLDIKSNTPSRTRTDKPKWLILNQLCLPISPQGQVSKERIALSNLVYRSSSRLTIFDQIIHCVQWNARYRTRTCKTLFLRQVYIPIPSIGQGSQRRGRTSKKTHSKWGDFTNLSIWD